MSKWIFADSRACVFNCSQSSLCPSQSWCGDKAQCVSGKPMQSSARHWLFVNVNIAGRRWPDSTFVLKSFDINLHCARHQCYCYWCCLEGVLPTIISSQSSLYRLLETPKALWKSCVQCAIILVFPGGQRSGAGPAVLATLWSEVHYGGTVPDWWVIRDWSAPSRQRSGNLERTDFPSNSDMFDIPLGAKANEAWKELRDTITCHKQSTWRPFPWLLETLIRWNWRTLCSDFTSMSPFQRRGTKLRPVCTATFRASPCEPPWQHLPPDNIAPCLDRSGQYRRHCAASVLQDCFQCTDQQVVWGAATLEGEVNLDSDLRSEPDIQDEN